MSAEAFTEVVRKVLLTYWNTVAFHVLYARLAGFVPGRTPVPPVVERPALDRWALSETHRTAQQVDSALDGYDTQRAGRLLADLIDDLSNWYVRRSRRRFWDGDAAALGTLHEVLRVLTLLMAPFTPFVTERVWQDLFAATSDELPDSVHLARWPEVDGSLVDDTLAAEQTALVRRLVELGRAARSESGVRTRQPLGRALVSAPAGSSCPTTCATSSPAELNVVTIETLGDGRRPRRRAGQGELPHPGPAVRPADPGGGRRRSPRPTQTRSRPSCARPEWQRSASEAGAT